MVRWGIILLFLAASTASAQISYPPIRFGASTPAACTPTQGPGELNLFWDNDDFVLKYCSATNTWTTVGGSGAPIAAEYLVLSNHATLTGERQFVAGAGVAGTDAGADSTYTLAVDLLSAQDAAGGTASFSGLEFQGAGTDKLALLQGCGDDQILKWDDDVGGDGDWNCANDETGAGGGDAITVATVAATDPDIIDSSRIDFTLNTVPAPDTITADIVADSINATYLDETSAYAFSSATNTFLGASFTGPTADPADTGIFRLSNAETGLCWEAAPAGTDVCLTVDASEIIQVSGGTLDAADLSGIVPDASVDGSAEAGEIDIDNLAGLTAIASAFTFTNGANVLIGATLTDGSADPADARFIRMGNNVGFGWELATPGTDKYLIVNTSDQLETNADIVGGSSTTNGSLTLGGASSTDESFLTLFGGDAATNAEAPYIRLIPSPVGSGDDSYLYPGGVGACLSVSSTAPAADSTNCLVDMTTARTLTNKTIAGLGSGTTHGTANFISLNRHATDCTAITDGVDGEACWEKDADTIYVCEPTAGGCDTAGEWIRVTAAGAGGDSITVATVAATDPDFIDSSRIDVTLATVPTPDTITWDIVANSVNATYIDETSAYAWSSTTNTFVGASYTDGSADPADAGVLRVGNNVSAICAEIATPGTDKCISLNASDAWAFSGTGDFILTATDTNGGFQFIPNGTGDFILGAGVTFTATMNTGSADPYFTFSDTSSKIDRTSSAPAANTYAFYSTNSGSDTAASNANQLLGGEFDALLLAANTQNWTSAQGLIGVYSATNIETGATGTVTGAANYIAAGTISAATLTNRYGLYVADTTGAGTVTNAYGVYVASLADGASTNYAIYTNGTNIAHFGGAIEGDYNVETSGNDFISVSKIWIDAASCIEGTAVSNWDSPDGAASTAPTEACNDTGSIQRPTLSFSGSAVNGVSRNFKLPSDWTGNIDIDIHYLSSAAVPAGNVEWEIQGICRAVGETWDAAFAAAQTITDAQVAQNTLNSATQTALTVTSCAAGEEYSLWIWRDGTNDTSNDVALMLGVELTIRRSQ